MNDRTSPERDHSETLVAPETVLPVLVAEGTGDVANLADGESRVPRGSAVTLSGDGAKAPTLPGGDPTGEGEGKDGDLQAASRRPTPTIPGFEVLSELGRGGMGVVYLARRTLLNRLCALKMILAAEYASPGAAIRFMAEAEAVAKLRHPNVVQIYSIGVQADHAYLELEYAEGGSLDQKLDGIPWAPRRAAAQVEPLARAAAEAHRLGVVHRDLKPANILLMADGTPKVADFGLAKCLGMETGVTSPDMVVGSPSYMAPEQAEGHAEDIGPAVDVYSLGAILYELLTGRPPFRGTTVLQTLQQVKTAEPVPPSRLAPATPRDVETICLKCLEKDPSRRYATAWGLADDLRRWLDNMPIRARPVGRPERLLRWCPRRPTLAALSAALFLVTVLGFAGVISAWSHAVASKNTAEHEKTVADAERKRAVGLAENLRLERDSARWLTYRSSIAAAVASLQLNNGNPTRTALETAPKEFRNWEWHHLNSQLDGARSVLRTRAFGTNSSDMAMTPDGQRVASYSGNGIVHLWDTSDGRPVAALPAAARWDARMMFTWDGRRLVFRAPDEALQVSDAETGNTVALLRRNTARITQYVISPDSRRVAAIASDQTLSVWDLESGAEVAAWPIHELLPLSTEAGTEASRQCMAYSADGSRVAYNGLGEAVGVLELATGKVEKVLRGPTSGIVALAYSPDGTRVVASTVYPQNQVYEWDPATGDVVAVLKGHRNQVTWVGFSPNSRQIMSCSDDETVRIWDAASGASIATLRGHTGLVNHMAINTAGTRLVTASEDQTLRLWDAATGDFIAVLRGHAGAVHRLALSRDGALIASSSQDGTIRFWDTALLERNGVLRGHTSYVYDVAFSPDGTRLASVAWDGTARLWDVATGDQTGLLKHNSNILTSVSFSRDGRALAVYERDAQRVTLWDASSNRQRLTLTAPNVRAQTGTRAALSPDARFLAVGSAEGAAALWELPTGAQPSLLRGHEAGVNDVAFRPDGAELATAGEDKTVRVWDPVRRTSLAVLHDHPESVYRLAYNGNGHLLAVASGNGVHLWDADKHTHLAVLPQGSKAYGMAFSPDGTRLAVGCSDKTIRLWDVATREEVAELRGHEAYVHAVAFSPDGTRLASASGDFTVRIWETIPVQKRPKSRTVQAQGR